MSTEMHNDLTIIDNGEGDEPLRERQMSPIFSSILEARLGRRQVLKGSAGAAAIGFLGLGLTGCNSDSDNDDDAGTPAPAPALLGFSAVPVNSNDTITVPEGYSYQVLIPWGTPITGDFPTFSVNSTGADQASQIGSHHDGIHFFPINDSSDDGLLVLNHEYIEPRLMHARAQGLALSGSAVPPLIAGQRPADEVLKEMNAHGVSIVRVIKSANNEWQVQPDAMNRRITALTPMAIQGPVRGSDFVKTKYSPNGTMTRGTLNNCGNGSTPWGTYMAAEENWAGYFSNGGDNPREHSAYGISTGSNGRYGWESADSGADEYIRFDASIKGASAIEDYRKRTAMGRFGHEGVVFAPAVEGRPVVCYSGDDSQFEYIYKFVSAGNYNAATASGTLLDSGTLYVAKFNADGSGEWLPLVFGQNGLTPANNFASQADVLVNTRTAADFMGATPMDRPEWGAVDPANGDVYFTLTNNSRRTAAQTDEANPRVGNPHGHIIRWAETGGDHAATTFDWDIFMFAGTSGEFGTDPSIGQDPKGDPLTADNILSSPDGMWIDPDSRVWIQMDSGATDPFGNCAMLAADPTTGDLKRFLVGPLGQEITGVITTPDQKTMFINVQHPGDDTTPANFAAGNYASAWPDNNPGQFPPRSATVVIWKDDGGIIGS